jgi:CRISPR-associated protein Cas1
MKKLLNTLFVTTQGSYLSKKGDTVLVSQDHETKLRVPIHNLDSIVCFGNVSYYNPSSSCLLCSIMFL